MLGHRSRHLDIFGALDPCAQPPNQLLWPSIGHTPGQRADDGISGIHRMGPSHEASPYVISSQRRTLYPARQAESEYPHRARQPNVSDRRVLDTHVFATLQQVQTITEQWLIDPNEHRPHEALGGVPPVQFIPRPTLAPTPIQHCLLDRRTYGHATDARLQKSQAAAWRPVGDADGRQRADALI